MKRLMLAVLMLLMCGLSADLYLRDNLGKARAGDYIVTYQNKAFTLLHISEKSGNGLTVEEITVPAQVMPKTGKVAWKEWVQGGAPGHTSWVVYDVDLESGKVGRYYSYSKNEWMAPADNFLSTLLNLRLELVPVSERKRVGPRPNDTFADRRKPWQPRMIVNGQVVEGVNFDEWRTSWPKDNSDLSGRTIEVFLPVEGLSEQYPSYFPYWLQISGMIGKAKIRIIDSGSGLVSPKPSLPSSIVPQL